MKRAIPQSKALLLKRPHITEKTTRLAEGGAYTFIVEKHATKRSVLEAIKALYGVSPRTVRVVNIPGKRVFTRGKEGKTASFKKAIVYLKKGDKIDLI